MNRRLLLLFVVLSLAFAPAPFRSRPAKRDTSEGDLLKMQGKWVRVKLGISSQPNEDNCPITITEKHMQFPSPSDAWTLTLDATQSPKTLDAVNVGNKASVFRGIYRFEGNDLIICWRGPQQSPERPTSFEAGVQGVWYQIYRRQ